MDFDLSLNADDGQSYSVGADSYGSQDNSEATLVAILRARVPVVRSRRVITIVLVTLPKQYQQSLFAC